MMIPAFAYSVEQWRRIEAIVERAGGAPALEKLRDRRAKFESIVRGWRYRLPLWNGHTFGPDPDHETFELIERAAGELRAGLLGLKTHFAEHLLPPPASKASLLSMLDHIRTEAAKKAKRGRKRASYARDRFVIDLANEWRIELGQRITLGESSAFIDFATAASEGLLKSQTEESTRIAIAHTIRKWKHDELAGDTALDQVQKQLQK